MLSGCADGITRVWTIDPARADPEAIEAFSASLAAKQAEITAAQAKAQGGAPAGLKLEDPSVIQRPGNRDGETKVVRENGVGVAYSWDAGVGQWERIGEVVGGPGVRRRPRAPCVPHDPRVCCSSRRMFVHATLTPTLLL